jgi:hypothetical protein
MPWRSCTGVSEAFPIRRQEGSRWRGGRGDLQQIYGIEWGFGCGVLEQWSVGRRGCFSEWSGRRRIFGDEEAFARRPISPQCELHRVSTTMHRRALSKSFVPGGSNGYEESKRGHRDSSAAVSLRRTIMAVPHLGQCQGAVWLIGASGACDVSGVRVSPSISRWHSGSRWLRNRLESSPK